jgi:hypothetical protein
VPSPPFLLRLMGMRHLLPGWVVAVCEGEAAEELAAKTGRKFVEFRCILR